MSAALNITMSNSTPHGQPNMQPQLSPLSIGLSFVLLTTLTAVAHLISQDYQEFKSLGPGGTPSTIIGYLRIKFLGLFAIHNPYMPPPIPPEIYLNRPSYLAKTDLPARRGGRPEVQGIAPHRQLDQRAPGDVFQNLRSVIRMIGARHSQKLKYGTSCLEKHGPGLFALQPINRSRHCNGEICHSHPSDGSTHLTLHPVDAAIVILRGWGERHPLSSGGWLARFVPQGFVMVYAPRNNEELVIIRRIVAAAVWWVGGVDVDSKLDGKEVPLMSISEEDAEADGEECEACQLPTFVGRMTS